MTKNIAKNKLPSDFLGRLDCHFEKNRKIYSYLTLGLTLIFGLLMFDLRVSVGGDDSAYIIRAYDFIHSLKYPSFQGPLYPMVLSIFVLIFGIKLSVLKFISLIFLLIHIFFFEKTFRKKIPASVLYPALILLSINSFILYFGSQTYSEAMFFTLQIIFSFYFLKFFVFETENIEKNLKINWKKYLLIAFLLFLMTITKSIAFACLGVIFIFLALTKKWKSIVFIFAMFLVISLSWEGIKNIIWRDINLQFAQQGNVLLYKHPYDFSQGKEDFVGYLGRIYDNSLLFLSRHYINFFGLLPPESNLTEEGYANTSVILTLLVLLIFVWSLLMIYKQNKTLLFVGLYAGIMLFTTFVSIQKYWDNNRIVIIYFPFALLLVLGGFYYTFKMILQKYKFVYPIIFLIFLMGTFLITSSRIGVTREIVKANLSGDALYGFTPDWRHYIEMCQWAAENVPANEVIACRKPEIAFIYTSRRFYGIYNVTSENADVLLENLYKNRVTYVIAASLRRDERSNTGMIINTVQYYLSPIAEKYPNKIEFVHQIGTDEDEPAVIYKILE